MSILLKPKFTKAMRYWFNNLNQSNPKQKSKTYGNNYYKYLNDYQKESFKRGVNNIADYLSYLKNNGELNDFTDDEITSFKNKTNNENSDYNDDLSQRIWGFLTQQKSDQFLKDQYNPNNRAMLGSNIVESVGKFHYDNKYSKYNDEELNAIKEFAKKYNLGDLESKIINHRFSNAIDPDTGYKYWSIYTNERDNGNGSYAPTDNIMFIYDTNKKEFKPIKANAVIDRLGGISHYNNIDVDENNGNRYYAKSVYGNYKNKDFYDVLGFEGTEGGYSYYDDKDPNGNYVWEKYNTEGQMELACGGKKYACGGRKYAYGGETEDVGMPLNMPQGYNAINEGGMHEQNPNGGVPYGMNSDGSQNLVEEGEASVGNNIVILFKITCKNLHKTIKLKKNKTINKNQNITHKKNPSKTKF